MPTLFMKGQNLPQFNLYQEVQTPTSDAEFKLKSESIGQITNSELLRGQLIELAKTRQENVTALEELENRRLLTIFQQQKNSTQRAKNSAELQKTNLELLAIDELMVRAGLQSLKTQGLNLELGYEKKALAQTKQRLELSLEKTQLALQQSQQENNDSLALLSKKFSHAVIDVPAIQIA
jgi:hypothetical protein